MSEKRYCSYCGKKLRLYGIDLSHGSDERIYCRRCRRFVWVNDDGKYDHNEILRASKLREKAAVRGLPKVVKIERRFCQYCRTKIDYTVANWQLNSNLQCPRCGEITFYADVVREKCLSCQNYEPNILGTYDKCTDSKVQHGHLHMNEAECTGYTPLGTRTGFDPMTGMRKKVVDA